MLDRGGSQFAADAFQVAQAILAAVAVNTNLDEFVCLEADIDFLQDGIGETILGNRYDRVQAVGAGAQFTNLGRQ